MKDIQEIVNEFCEIVPSQIGVLDDITGEYRIIKEGDLYLPKHFHSSIIFIIAGGIRDCLFEEKSCIGNENFGIREKNYKRRD